MHIEKLGQSGIKLNIDDLEILIDPYLSNYVEEFDSPDLVRKFPILYKPHELNKTDWILITHNHIDHCDPKTLPLIAKHNKKAKFVGPLSVRKLLKSWNIEEERIFAPTKGFLNLGNSIKVKSTSAAHPVINLETDNTPSSIGWFFNIKGITIYIAGDTSLCEEIILELKELEPINFAFLPVNEDNFYRRRRGIIGNMSIREAFGMADELEVDNVIPMHWDLFEVNGALEEEIEVVYKGYNWKFNLIMDFNKIFE